MIQEIKEISVKDLVLWTENPRDPVDTQSSDQDAADRAISGDGRSRWSLGKLFRKMGPRFDQSEIPTVAYVEDKPVVYDGNRRVLIGKIIHGYVKVDRAKTPDFSKFSFPKIIPCNVCDRRTAYEHVDRKHSESGSWKPLERDIFKHKHMKQNKSVFLILEEETKLITRHPILNRRFVKEEIFDPSTLLKLGFSTNDNKLQSKYKDDKDAQNVLDKIIKLVETEIITTRKNRGRIIDLVGRGLLSKQGDSFKSYVQTNTPRKTPVTRGKKNKFFGGKLILKPGSVNNIYSDLLELFKGKDRRDYSGDFPMIIRMGLRLVVDLAAQDGGLQMKRYISQNYQSARQRLSQDEKTTLSTKSIGSHQKLIELLNVGAHGSSAANDMEQTIAMSLIIGKMLEITHGK